MDGKRCAYRVMALLLVAVCLLCCVATLLPAHDPLHTCTGEDCLVCLCISLREQLAGLLFVPAGLLLVVCFVRLGTHRDCVIASARRWTPVCLKVKLSN